MSAARRVSIGVALLLPLAAACFPDRTQDKACDEVLGCLDGYTCIDEVCVPEGSIDDRPADAGVALSDAGG